MKREHDPRAAARQEAAHKLRTWKRSKIKDVYDNEAFPAEALYTLLPEFEYPEWDYMTVGAFLAKNA